MKFVIILILTISSYAYEKFYHIEPSDWFYKLVIKKFGKNKICTVPKFTKDDKLFCQSLCYHFSAHEININHSDVLHKCIILGFSSFKSEKNTKTSKNNSKDMHRCCCSVKSKKIVLELANKSFSEIKK